MEIGSGSGAFLDQCWLSLLGGGGGLPSIRLGYFRPEQKKRLRLQEQLVTKFPFVRGRKAPASSAAVQSPLIHHCCHP